MERRNWEREREREREREKERGSRVGTDPMEAELCVALLLSFGSRTVRLFRIPIPFFSLSFSLSLSL